MRLMAGLAGACALALTACSCSSTPAAATSASSSAAASAAAASKVTLVVYSAQGYDSAMTKAFTQATGIPVKLDDNSTGPLLTQIEASKNNPNWGLLWVDGATAVAGLDTQGLHRREGTRGRAGRGGEVHRVRSVTRGPEGHAERRPDR
jgi:iron(III) transport system substrate-binding protein